MANWINRAKRAPVNETATIGKYELVIMEDYDEDNNQGIVWSVTGPNGSSRGLVLISDGQIEAAVNLAKALAIRVVTALDYCPAPAPTSETTEAPPAA
jgi:hypothetical protein